MDYVLIGIISLIFNVLVFGFLCMNLAEKKGYTGYFVTGALLGIIGLFYVAFLPMKRYSFSGHSYTSIESDHLNNRDNRENLEKQQKLYQVDYEAQLKTIRENYESKHKSDVIKT